MRSPRDGGLKRWSGSAEKESVGSVEASSMSARGSRCRGGPHVATHARKNWKARSANAVRRDSHLSSGAGIEPDGIVGGSFLRIQAMRRDQGGSRGLERRAVAFLGRDVESKTITFKQCASQSNDCV